VDVFGALGLQIEAAMGFAAGLAPVVGLPGTADGFVGGTDDLAVGVEPVAKGLPAVTSGFREAFAGVASWVAAGAFAGAGVEAVDSPPMTTGVRHLRHGTVPFRACRSRTTSSPTVNSVEHTLQRTCMSQDHLPTAGFRRHLATPTQTLPSLFFNIAHAVLPRVDDRSSNCNIAVDRSRRARRARGSRARWTREIPLVCLAYETRLRGGDSREASR
jgi:hypothetical protein